MKVEDIGHIYKDEAGNYWRLVSYCQYPTATMEKIGSGERASGAVGSPNLTQFTPADPLESAVVEQLLNQAPDPRNFSKRR